MVTIGLSDSEYYAIETVIFTMMNTIVIVGLCGFISTNTNLSSIVSAHDFKLIFHHIIILYKFLFKQSGSLLSFS